MDNIFDTHEDNFHPLQDVMLLSLIENENGVNDKDKIKYLFKRYRDTARDLNNC